MYTKILIKVTCEVRTGLHIGTSNAYSAIGTVDSPVAIDAHTGYPIIPGSSLKGKLRTLLARSFAVNARLSEPKNDAPEVCRLFGTVSEDGRAVPSRLQFADCFLSESSIEELKETGITEVKYENTINRITGVAMPRQIERVVRGARFDVCIGYDAIEQQEIEEDLYNLAQALRLLQMDYLGGHGTRGCGRVSFKDFCILDEGALESELKKRIEVQFKSVSDYELLPL